MRNHAWLFFRYVLVAVILFGCNSRSPVASQPPVTGTGAPTPSPTPVIDYEALQAKMAEARAGLVWFLPPNRPATLPPQPTVADLIQALNDKDIDVRRYAAPKLRETGNEPDAVKGWLAISGSSREAPNGGLWVGAGKAGDYKPGNPGPAAKDVVPALTRALTDSDHFVRMNAAFALVSFGQAAKDAVPALIQALADSNASVRMNVAFALGSIGPAAKDAVPALIESVTDKLAGSNAVLALRAITGQDCGEDAACWQQWWEEHK